MGGLSVQRGEEVHAAQVHIFDFFNFKTFLKSERNIQEKMSNIFFKILKNDVLYFFYRNEIGGILKQNVFFLFFHKTLFNIF